MKDAAGNVTDTITDTYDADGELLTAANTVGTYTITYDGAGRVTHVTEPFGVTLGYGYDLNSNQTSVSDSFGGVETSTYDADSRLVTRIYSGQSQQMRVDYTYDNDGRVLTQIQYDTTSGPVVLAGTNVVSTTTNVYDAAGQITSITSVKAGGGALESFAYTYDNGGNVTAETDTQNSTATATSYSYDASGQLSGVNSGTYSYNADGNQSGTGDTTGADNQLLSDGTYNYTYDVNGNEATKVNISTGDNWTYGYNAANQLTSAVEKTSTGTVEQTVTYKYDAFGNRIEKDDVASGTTTVQRYAYDGWNPAKVGGVGNENFDIWADLSGTSSLTTRYLNGDGTDQHLGRIDMPGGATTEWYLTDHLGSTRAVVNNSGTVKDSITYDAFGNITSDTSATYRGRYAWTGREIDTETGLQYNRARYYDPHSGRWMTQDPMGFDAGDSNLYRYAMNRPTGATDPSGKDFVIRESSSVAGGKKGQVMTDTKIYCAVTRFGSHTRTDFVGDDVDGTVTRIINGTTWTASTSRVERAIRGNDSLFAINWDTWFKSNGRTDANALESKYSNPNFGYNYTQRNDMLSMDGGTKLYKKSPTPERIEAGDYLAARANEPIDKNNAATMAARAKYDPNHMKGVDQSLRSCHFSDAGPPRIVTWPLAKN